MLVAAVDAPCDAHFPVSARILAKELRELEAWGLITRKEDPLIPPKTEYRLTERGKILQPIMIAIADRGLAHRDAIVTTPAIPAAP